jgi:hypothetical protein
LAEAALVTFLLIGALEARYRRVWRRLRVTARRLRNLLHPGPHAPQAPPQRARRPARRLAKPCRGPDAGGRSAGSGGFSRERLIKPAGTLTARHRRTRRRIRIPARRLRSRLRRLLHPGPRGPQTPPGQKRRRRARRPAEPAADQPLVENHALVVISEGIRVGTAEGIPASCGQPGRTGVFSPAATSYWQLRSSPAPGTLPRDPPDRGGGADLGDRRMA